MDIIVTDTFTLLLEKVSNYKGYTLLEILPDDGMCNIYRYYTKSAFESDFGFKIVDAGVTVRLLPNHIVRDYREYVTCLLQGKERHIRVSELYLVLDGELCDNEKMKKLCQSLKERQNKN